MKRPLVASLVAAGAFAVGGIALAGTTQYRADLRGSSEVPPVQTSGEASFKLKLSEDGQSARYDLKIDEPLTDLFMAHLHMAPPGVNGGIVVWLFPSPAPVPFPPPPPAIPGEFDGRLASGVITVDDLVGALDNNWTGFVSALEAGNIYVNVHTLANPGGEVRDQFHLHPGDND